MPQCFTGWSQLNGNSAGRCCCNCKYQITIMRHPWNVISGGRMKGPITEIAGWACNPDNLPGYVFFENEHSMCEMHDWRTNESNEGIL